MSEPVREFAVLPSGEDRVARRKRENKMMEPQNPIDHQLGTAGQILDSMASVYARCLSYRDRGRARRHVFPDNRVSYSIEQYFSTTYIRSGRFRSEYRHSVLPGGPELRSVVWASGKDVRSWRSELDSVQLEESLPNALMALGGVSDRVSWVVPFLLLTEWGGRAWDLSDISLLADGELYGLRCYRVQGRFASTQGQRGVWSDSSGIRRFKSRRNEPGHFLG